VADFFRAGATLVWIVDPRKRTVVVRTPMAPERTLTEDDVLDGGDVLPGFRVPVREVFEDLETRLPPSGAPPSPRDATDEEARRTCLYLGLYLMA
jgi:hypothetical protein